jgi:hypothetical protein
MPVDTTTAPPQLQDLDLALVTIAKVTRNSDLRHLSAPERKELRSRIVCAITNLECVLTMLRPAT